MSDRNISVLNSVTKTLVDSCNGYKKCAELEGTSPGLKAEFSRRKIERDALTHEFQNHVRSLGGEPETEGSMLGAVHRGFTRFANLFSDDQDAAISALDDGEEFLAEKIEDKLEDSTDLSTEVRTLLQKAHVSAKEGERFADLLDD